MMLFLLKDKCFFKTYPRVMTKVYGYIGPRIHPP